MDVQENILLDESVLFEETNLFARLFLLLFFFLKEIFRSTFFVSINNGDTWMLTFKWSTVYIRRVFRKERYPRFGLFF